MRRRALGSALVVAMLALASVTLASAAAALTIGISTRVYVSPASGGPGAKFRLSFRVPAATGTTGSVRRVDTLSVSGPHRHGCVSGTTQTLVSAKTAARLRVTLNPDRLGGRWCVGAFHGRIVQTQSIICGPQRACPLLVIAPQTIARFGFRVTRGA